VVLPACCLLKRGQKVAITKCEKLWTRILRIVCRLECLSSYLLCNYVSLSTFGLNVYAIEYIFI
jgi:hypothetical protein